jgi:sugar phosphate isomerase/epimerase
MNQRPYLGRIAELEQRLQEADVAIRTISLLVKDGDHEAQKLKERIEELEQVRDAANELLSIVTFPFPGVWEAFSHARAVLEGEGG